MGVDLLNLCPPTSILPHHGGRKLFFRSIGVKHKVVVKLFTRLAFLMEDKQILMKGGSKRKEGTIDRHAEVKVGQVSMLDD
jgi:hypothetical protein